MMPERSSDNSTWRAYEETELTHSAAHYLTAILGLRQRFGYARVTDVAEDLGISRGAASRALTMLKERGWIQEDPHRMLELTAAGQDLAHGVVRSHAVIERFMVDILGVPGQVAHEDACKMEHLMSPVTVEALVRLIRTFEGDKRLKNRFKELLGACRASLDTVDPLAEIENEGKSR